MYPNPAYISQSSAADFVRKTVLNDSPVMIHIRRSVQPEGCRSYIHLFFTHHFNDFQNNIHNYRCP
jgi:hypothetical protein